MKPAPQALSAAPDLYDPKKMGVKAKDNVRRLVMEDPGLAGGSEIALAPKALGSTKESGQGDGTTRAVALRLYLRASEPGAQRVVDEMLALVGRNFDEDGSEDTRKARRARKVPPMAEIVVSGLPASVGLACGALYEFSAGVTNDGDDTVEAAALASPDDEAQALRAAIELAAQQLEALMARSDPASAEIIEFQQAFVLDDELSAPAFAAIANGRSARAHRTPRWPTRSPATSRPTTTTSTPASPTSKICASVSGAA